MRNTIFVVMIIFCTIGKSHASPRSVTFYADGALVEIEASTTKGVIEIPLSSEIIENSLRIKPLGDVVLKQVEIVASKTDAGKKEKNPDELLEQRNRLLDRLKALETREQIFISAAKSQSGKAPRKTKANPDPMQSIRQGTDFAIAQLESVYTARRKTEQELKRIDIKIANARRNSTGSGKTARISLATQRGSVAARYLVSGPGWTPHYDLRVTADGMATVDMSVNLPEGFTGYRRYAALSRPVESARAVAVSSGATVASLSHYRMPVSEQFFGNDAVSGFSFAIKNTEKQYFPPGESTIYLNGEYRGKARFNGFSSGRSLKIGSEK